MGRNNRPFVVTSNILSQLKRVGKDSCSGCNVQFKVGDPVLSNSNNKKKYHYLCAMTLKMT